MSDPKSRNTRGASTRAIHGPGPDRHGSVSTPIVRSTTFSFPSLASMLEERERHAAGAFYQRLGHPTIRACEERLAGLEGAETALLFASGMAAISSVFLAHVKAGEHVVAIDQCYGGTLDALLWGSEHLGWSFERVDSRDQGSWERAVRNGTRILHVESPTNPALCVIDLARAAELAHRQGALLTVDNTVASPVGQHPLALGADVVMYSATKSIGGHSDLLAGVVAGSTRALEAVYDVRSILGAVADPAVAWLIERSMKTMPLRVERANANALELARRLSRNPHVSRVFYPGLDGHPGAEVAKRQMVLGYGPVVSFDVAGGASAAETVIEAFQLVRHAPSLGSVESLASLPGHTSHRHMSAEERSRAGIPEGLVRLSVGIEDLEDLWADLDQALGVRSAMQQESQAPRAPVR